MPSNTRRITQREALLHVSGCDMGAPVCSWAGSHLAVAGCSPPATLHAERRFVSAVSGASQPLKRPSHGSGERQNVAVYRRRHPQFARRRPAIERGRTSPRLAELDDDPERPLMARARRDGCAHAPTSATDYGAAVAEQCRCEQTSDQIQSTDKLSATADRTRGRNTFTKAFTRSVSHAKASSRMSG